MTDESGSGPTPGTGAETPALTAEEHEALRQLSASVPDTVRRDFDERLTAWKRTWSQPRLAMSSDTRDYTQGPEFEALVGLGPAALPLALQEMATTPDGFFLLAAVERWQNRDDLVATSEAAPLESQQSRARRVLREAASG